MTPVLSINGREVPIAGWRAMSLQRMGGWMDDSVEWRDIEHCGHLHLTDAAARECAKAIRRAEIEAQLQLGGPIDTRWGNFRIEAVRDLPEEPHEAYGEAEYVPRGGAEAADMFDGVDEADIQ